jgi:hypothetical protein
MLPGRLIEACRAARREFFVIALEGQANPETVQDAPHQWVRLGAAGTIIDLLKKEKVGEVVLAGQVRRPSLAELRPDLRASKLLLKFGAAAAIGDGSLLTAVAQELEKEEFQVVGAHQILDTLLAPEGVQGKLGPDQVALANIQRGMAVAHGLGALDVGQAVIVQEGIVLCVEAVEGTDALIERSRALRREGAGGVLVKAKKPGQDDRLDLPAIGPRTVELAARAGLCGIAVEAGGTLLIDRDRLISDADAAGIFVIGIDPRA